VKILIGPSTFASEDRTPLRRLQEAGLEIIPNPYGRKLTASELEKLLAGAVGLLAGLEPLTRAVLERSQLRVISRVGAGVSNVDLEAAHELGIEVRNTPDAPTNAVAELTIGVMLCLIRHVALMDRDLHSGMWQKRIGMQIEERTVAVIGYGRIGRRVAELLRPFRPRLLAVDPLVHEAEGVEMVTLETALRVADIVTCHVSGEAEVIGARELAWLRRGAVLLNSSRGGVINETALCDALRDSAVAAAWVDTFVEEPYSGPLLKFPHVLLTPHIGSASIECRRRMEDEAVTNLLSVLRPA